MPYFFDTETELIAPGNQAPKIVCLSVSDGTLVKWDRSAELAAALLDSDHLIGGHNVAFDCAVVAAQEPRLLPKIFQKYERNQLCDTGVRQKLIDLAHGNLRGWFRGNGKPEKIGYGLGDGTDPPTIGLARRLFGVNLDKDTYRLRYGELMHVPLDQWPEGAKKYAIDDAQILVPIYDLQEQHADLLADQYRQFRAAFWLKLTSIWGITTNPEAVRKFTEMTKREYDRLAADLVAHGLLRPDRPLKSGPRKGQIVEGSRDTKVAKARLEAAYVAQGREVPRTPTGEPSLEESACVESGDDVLAAYAELSSLKKTLSENIPVLWSGTRHPIHTFYDELKETGRVGSSHPQLMNLPRKVGIRECHHPRRGFVFADADYNVAELCGWAQVCKSVLGFSRLAEVINGGDDPHLEMAATLQGISSTEVKERYKSGDKVIEEARQFAKIPDFGLPGGLGAETFVAYAAQNGFKITLERAQEVKDLWHQTWPEAKHYFRWINSLVDKDFPVVEQLFSGRYRGGVRFTSAANGFFQGIVADAAKSAGWLIARACYIEHDSVLYGSRLVVFNHDEFLIESPIERGHECSLELSRLMVEGARPWMPDVPPKAEPKLMKYWSKNAKPVFVDGRLVPTGQYRGIWWNEPIQQWSVTYKKNFVGSHPDEETAARWYDHVAMQHGDTNLNFKKAA